MKHFPNIIRIFLQHPLQPFLQHILTTSELLFPYGERKYLNKKKKLYNTAENPF